VSRAVSVRTESRFCSRCQERVDGQVWLDADENIVDSEGFLVFEQETLCDACLDGLGAGDSLTEMERAFMPDVRVAAHRLVGAGLIDVHLRHGLRLTPSGVALLLGEWDAHDESKRWTKWEIDLLHRLARSSLQQPGSFFRTLLHETRKGRWTAEWAVVAHRMNVEPTRR
jgi:hypothetical protein